MISIVANDVFATPPSLPPGSIRMEISELPVLGQEFGLTIFFTPDNYDENWVQASGEKKWMAKFTIILPKGFEIIDDDFSEGRPYHGIHGKAVDGYLFYSASRDVGFPPQTTVKIKPTELGIWQIIADHGAFIPGKIFVTLTEGYSYVSDRPNNDIKRVACGKDPDDRHDSIAMFDVESNSIIRNAKNDFMIENNYNNWKIVTNPATDLIYVYERYTPTIPIIHGNSGETRENLKLTAPSEIRISDIAVNPEANLIYLADNGRVNWKPHNGIIVLDGDDHSIVSIIEYGDRTGETDPVASVAINPKTNALYAMTVKDNLYTVDLDTEEVIAKLNLGTDGRYGSHDVEVNSVTNKVYALTGALYVIDGNENSVEKIIPIEKGANKVQINERDNEIYLLSYSAGQLLIMNGTDYNTDTINLQRSGFEVEFDPAHDRLYVPSEDGSITVIDTNTLEFDIMDDCSRISSISINPETGILSAVDEAQYVAVNVIEPVGPNQRDRMWIENSGYPRTEYLPSEKISLNITNAGEADIAIDSVLIKNTNTGIVAVEFTEPQTIGQNSFIGLVWNQTDSSGRQVPPDRYAVILKGHDDKSVLYEAHKVFSIIDKDRLDRLESLHKGMFSYLRPTGSDSEDTVPPTGSDDPTQAGAVDDSASRQSQLGAVSADTMCKNNPVLVTLNYERFACVRFTSSETLVERGWEVVSTKSGARVPSGTPDDVSALRDVMHNFPLFSEFTGNSYARFNVEFSHRPVLGEGFDIAIKYEILDNEFSSKKSGKTIPFTLTLSDGVEYVVGDMKETERKYSLVTGQYNTMYETENLSTVPGTYESASTLKFLQPGEHYFGVHASGQFDAFWFFVDADGTAYLKEDITYDNGALYQLMLILGAYHPESVEDELETVFGSGAKRVLEEYYLSHEYQRPIAPADMLTTRVQLQDVMCQNGIFYKFAPDDSPGWDGIHCGSESVLEYYADQSRSLEVYERNKAIRLLTINTGSAPMSDKSIFRDTLERDLKDEWFPSRLLTHKDKALLPSPYHYLGESCSNNALYATFEVPEQVKVGDAFDIVLRYSWKVPNPNWDVMSKDDKETMQNLRDKYLPLLGAANGDHSTLAGAESEDRDAMLDQMVEILNKYGLDGSDSNMYGYQITEYYPECDAPVLSVEFLEELEILSDGFEITGSPDKHKVVHYHGKKAISFGNDQPHTSILTAVIREPTFHLVNLLRIWVAGHGGFFAFSVTNDTATFNHYSPDSLERLPFTPQIDKFGNAIPLHERGDTPYRLDNVLVEYSRLDIMSIDEARQLQLEFLKYQVLNPDHDFATFYKIFSGTDVTDEIDFVAAGPPMEDFAELIREHILDDEDDIEAWLYSTEGLHNDWIEAFLAKYPEFNN